MGNYPTILFYPERNKETPMSRTYRVCREYGIPFHNDPSKSYDLHIFWSYTPNRIVPDQFTLTDKNVINRGCWDISKVKVNTIFNDISINPEEFTGICVEKADRQGDHGNHRLIQCPVKPKEGYVYQRYIENKEDGLFVKYRVYYADGIEWILRQRKRALFGSPNYNWDYVTHEWVDKRKIFSEEQENDFNEKCKEFGFDYGDVDFLMDGNLPVIIDINNVVSHISFNHWIKKVQDDQFINFILRRYDKTG